MRDPATQVICYARLSPDGDSLVSTGVRAGRGARAPVDLPLHIRINSGAARKQALSERARFDAGRSTPRGPAFAAPCNGNVKGICLIVDFPDSTGTIASSVVDDFCNKPGYNGFGNNGSIRDYFAQVSNGNLDYTNYVSPVYYRAIHDKGYYDNPAESAGPKAQQLILEALAWLDAGGFDFSQYDSNGDGYVDALNCFYAGNCNSGWAKGLWPHSWSVFFSADGVYTGNYQISYMGSSLQMRTFCHENGHMICYWPDLYDYGFESNGIGNYCLMGYGASNTNPVEPCPYMKLLAGWASITTLSAPAENLPAPFAGNVVYRFPHPTAPNEYYLVNNLQRTGRGSGYPDAGLALWHIDANGSNDNEQMTSTSHYEVTLVQADNRWDLENRRNYGDSADLFDAASNPQCMPDTTPGTNWWSTAASGLKILRVSASGTTMTFTFGDPPQPVVTKVTSPHADGAFTVGEPIPVQVQFNKAVTVTGAPTLSLNARTGGATAAYTGGSGTNVLGFEYTVAAGDSTPDLDYRATGSLSPNGGAIKDAVSPFPDADPTLALPASGPSLAGNKAIRVDTASPSSVASVSDLTRAGTSTLELNFTATDGSGAGVASTRLFVKPPGAGAFTDTGVTRTGTGGKFSYNVAGGDGAYAFATQATDIAGNAEAAPVTAEITIVLNETADSEFTQVAPTANAALVFPMRDDIDVTVTLAGATPGGALTVARSTPRGAAPAGISYPTRLLDERLEITASGLGALTATLDWPFDPANAAGMGALPIDTAYRCDAGVLTSTLPATVTGGRVRVTGITGFSTWYAGNASAVPVTVSVVEIQ